MAEEATKENIEIQITNSDQNTADIPKDNNNNEEMKESYNDNKKNYETVFDSAMTLKSEFNNEEFYEATNWRLTMYWLFLWILVITYHQRFESTASIICIVIYILTLIAHIILFITLFIRKNRNNNSFNDELNLLFGIKKKDPQNIYNLDSISTNYIGAIFIIIAINMCLMLLIARIMYPDVAIDDKGDLCARKYETGPGACLLFTGFNSVVYANMGITFAILCFQLYALRDEVVAKMIKFKKEKILSVKHCKIGHELDETISDSLKKWQTSLSWTKRKGEYLVIFIFSAAILCYIPESYDDNYSKYVGDVLVFAWLVGLGSWALSIIAWILISSIKYFRYPTIIMRILRDPIEGDTIEDFVVWWQLRKYFIENEVRLTRRVLNMVLTAAFIASVGILLATLNFAFRGSSNITDQASYVYKGMFGTLFLFGFVLGLAQNASQFYVEQLRHKEMLVREKLRIESKRYYGDNNDNDDGDITTRNDEQLLRVINAMIADVEQTVVAIEMGGVKITPNIMLLIRGYVASGIIAAAAAYF